MPITSAKPTTTPIPVQLSASAFTQFILPHLSMPKRGPKCKLGYHRVFNLILWVLYTGMQWKCLPIPQDSNGKPAIHYTTVYKVVFHVWRGKLSSIAYSEKLNSFTISATLQSTDRRYGIVGQKSADFQLDSRKR